MVQAALFLDQLFKTLQITDLDEKLIRLDGLDHTIRTFLAIAMDQSQGRLGPFCVVNSMIERSAQRFRSILILIEDRALLILHAHILDQVQYTAQCKRRPPAQWRANSHSVLNTVIRMMDEVIINHNEIPLSHRDTVPPTTACLVRVVLEYVRCYGVDNVGWDCEGEMGIYMQRYNYRWGFDSPKYV